LILVLAHAAGLALTIFTIVRSGDRPQVLLYAFILDYCFRLATIYVLTRHGPALAPHLSSRPTPDDRPAPLRYEGSKAAVGWSGYAALMLFFSGLAFVLANVNQHHEVDVDVATVLEDARWSLRLAAIYWVEGIVARTTVLDPGAPIEVNLGYNTREVVVLAFATLTAGVVVMVRQANGLNRSGWVLLGPLLAFRSLFDLMAARRLRAR
jgi:hypothetical protein